MWTHKANEPATIGSICDQIRIWSKNQKSRIRTNNSKKHCHSRHRVDRQVTFRKGDKEWIKNQKDHQTTVGQSVVDGHWMPKLFSSFRFLSFLFVSLQCLALISRGSPIGARTNQLTSSFALCGLIKTFHLCVCMSPNRIFGHNLIWCDLPFLWSPFPFHIWASQVTKNSRTKKLQPE